jgi:hypothetical protein
MRLNSVYAQMRQAVEAAGGSPHIEASNTDNRPYGHEDHKTERRVLVFRRIPDASTFMKFASAPKLVFSQALQVTYATQTFGGKLMAILSTRGLPSQEAHRS